MRSWSRPSPSDSSRRCSRGCCAWPTVVSPRTRCSPRPPRPAPPCCGGATKNPALPGLEPLPDGSFRSELVATPDKYRREDVLAVRVVEYAIDDEGRPGAIDTTYR